MQRSFCLGRSMELRSSLSQKGGNGDRIRTDQAKHY